MIEHHAVDACSGVVRCVVDAGGYVADLAQAVLGFANLMPARRRLMALDIQDAAKKQKTGKTVPIKPLIRRCDFAARRFNPPHGAKPER